VSATEDLKTEIDARIDAIEEAYEFFLAYAAQGLPTDAGSDNGRQARQHLERSDAALGGLGDCLTRYVEQQGLSPAGPYLDFISVIDRDARRSQAAIRLVLAQAAIGSQIVDNLNASIHLRALLTDLFLIDEVLKSHSK
jgi:hypothetical protein